MIFEDRGRKKAYFYGTGIIKENISLSPQGNFTRGGAGDYQSPSKFKPYDGAKQYSLEGGPHMLSPQQRIQQAKKKQEYNEYCTYMASLQKYPKSEQQYHEDMMSLERRPDTREIKQAKQRIYADDLQEQIEEKRKLNGQDRSHKLNPLNDVPVQGVREISTSSIDIVPSLHNFYSSSTKHRSKHFDTRNSSPFGKSVSPIQKHRKRSSGTVTPSDFFSGKKIQPLKETPKQQLALQKKKQQELEDRLQMDALIDRQEQRQLNRELASDAYEQSMDRTIIPIQQIPKQNGLSPVKGDDRIGEIATKMLIEGPKRFQPAPTPPPPSLPTQNNNMNSQAEKQAQMMHAQLEIMQKQLATNRELDRMQKQQEEEKLRREHEAIRRQMEVEANRRKREVEEHNARIIERQLKIQHSQSAIQEEQDNIIKKTTIVAQNAVQNSANQASNVSALRSEMSTQLTKISEEMQRLRQEIKQQQLSPQQQQQSQDQQIQQLTPKAEKDSKSIESYNSQENNNQNGTNQQQNHHHKDGEQDGFDGADHQAPTTKEMLHEIHTTNKLLQDLTTSIEKKEFREESRYESIKKSVNDIADATNNSPLIRSAAKQSLHHYQMSPSIGSTASTSLRKRHQNQSLGGSPQRNEEDHNIFKLNNFTQNFYVNGTPRRSRNNTTVRLLSFLNLKDALGQNVDASTNAIGMSAPADRYIIQQQQQQARVLPKVQKSANVFTPRRTHKKPDFYTELESYSDKRRAQLPQQQMLVNSAEKPSKQKQGVRHSLGDQAGIASMRSKSNIDHSPISSRLSEYTLGTISPNKRRALERASQAATPINQVEDSAILKNLDIIDTIVQASGNGRTHSAQLRSVQRYNALVASERHQLSTELIQTIDDQSEINPNYISLVPFESPSKSLVYKIQHSPGQPSMMPNRGHSNYEQVPQLRSERISVADRLMRDLDGILIDAKCNRLE